MGLRRKHKERMISPDRFIVVWLIIAMAAISRAADAPSPPLTAIRTFLDHSGAIYDVAFSHSGKLAASGGEDKLVRLWDFASGKQLRVLQGHFERIRSIAFSPDDLHVASASNDATVRVWNVQTGELESILGGHNGAVWRVTYAGPSRILSIGSDQLVCVWDAPNEKVLCHFDAVNDEAGMVSVSADSHSALICGKNAVVLVDLEKGDLIRRFDSGAGAIHLLRFGPDDRTIEAITADPDKLFIWNKSDASIVREVDWRKNMDLLAMSSDGKVLIAGVANGFARCDPETGEVLQLLTGIKGSGSACSLSPDGRYLLGSNLKAPDFQVQYRGTNYQLCLWDLVEH